MRNSKLLRGFSYMMKNHPWILIYEACIMASIGVLCYRLGAYGFDFGLIGAAIDGTAVNWVTVALDGVAGFLLGFGGFGLNAYVRRYM